MSVVCFGELLLRMTPPHNQLLRQASSLDVFVGGAEANVAVALACLGHSVRWLGSVSDNPLGDRAADSLRSVGVETCFLIRARGRMGLYFLEEGAGARPSSITYDRANSAFADTDVQSINFAGAVEGARLFHCGGITPALGPNGVELARSANRNAAAAGVPISFDGNFRAQLWRQWSGDPARILNELVSDATILFGNHRDVSLLLGSNFPGDTADDRRNAASAALAAFPKLQMIASTRRQRLRGDVHRLSARVDTRDTFSETKEVEVSAIVDRIGTGDAFAAGVLHGWLEQLEAPAIAEAGLALSVLKHSLQGDLCLIDRNRLDAFSASGSDVER